MAPIAQRGLIIGKFLPPTAGHLHLVSVAASLCRELTVLVCTLRREPIDGATRLAWMRELNPGVRVLHCDEELPSYPEEDPDFWKTWRDAIHRHAGPVDVLFSSEDYGDRLARELGAAHHLVDRARATMPISGTTVRADPLRAWEFLPAPVRAHYALRIAIVGPESTGKTTLAGLLAAHYRTTWVPEFARAYVDRIGGLEKLRFDDIAIIAAGQAATEDAAARTCNRVLFTDTDLTTTTVYALHYFGDCPEAVLHASRQRRYALVLLTGIDLPWIADPQRDQPHRREELFERFRDALRERGQPFADVRGTGPGRLQAAIHHVDGAIGATGTAWRPGA